MGVSTLQNNPEASTANSAEKNADNEEHVQVGCVFSDVFESYMDGFHLLVEEYKAKLTQSTSVKPEPVTSSSKSNRVSNEEERPITKSLEPSANSVENPVSTAKKTKSKSKKASSASVKPKPVTDDSKIDQAESNDAKVINDTPIVQKKDKKAKNKGRRDSQVGDCYNYMLIDSQKCPNGQFDSVESFKDAVFFVGKGKNTRSEDYIEEAKEYYTGKKDTKSRNKIIQKINDIWNEGFPVFVIEFAMNITSDKADTQKALLIDEIGIENLSNTRRGSYKPLEKTKDADVLLMEAKNCFLKDNGYKKIPPPDVDRRNIKCGH